MYRLFDMDPASRTFISGAIIVEYLDLQTHFDSVSGTCSVRSEEVCEDGAML
jgi:hypothetical protein